MTHADFETLMIRFSEARMRVPEKILLSPPHFKSLTTEIYDKSGAVYSPGGYHTLKLATPIGMAEVHQDVRISQDQIIIYDTDGKEYNIELATPIGSTIITSPKLPLITSMFDGTDFVLADGRDVKGTSYQKEVDDKRDTLYDADFIDNLKRV